MNNEPTDNQLEKLLQEIGQEAKPTAKFQQTLLKDLKAKYRETYGSTPWLFRLLKLKLQFASVLTLLTLTTTTIYAYSSDSIVSGDFLYPLKRSAEKVEVLFATNEEDRSNYYSKMAERRTRELQHIEKQSENYSNTIRESEKMIELAKSELKRLEQRKPLQIDRLIDRDFIKERADVKVEADAEIKTETRPKRTDNKNIKTEKNPELLELRSGPITNEKSINLPITSENNVKFDRKIKDNTILRSRIEKVESDIERLKESRKEISIPTSPLPTR